MTNTEQPEFPPGVWRTKGGSALLELRYSSTGVPIFCGPQATPFVPRNLEEYELVEPGATLSSPLFRTPSAAQADDATFLRFTKAALQGLATHIEDSVSAEMAGRWAVRAAHSALRALRSLEGAPSAPTR